MLRRPFRTESVTLRAGSIDEADLAIIALRAFVQRNGDPIQGGIERHRLPLLVADVEKALRDTVARLRDELIDPAELERIVTQAVAGKVFEADSLFYQAMEIGLLETIGLDWRLATQELARLKAVTPEQVQAVAKKYFVPDNLTVAVLEPQSMGQDETTALNGNGGDADVR